MLVENPATEHHRRIILDFKLVGYQPPEEYNSAITEELHRVNYWIGRIFCVALIVLNLVWWPTDSFILPEADGVFFLWRSVCVSLGLLGFLGIRALQRRRYSPDIPLAIIALVIVGWSFYLFARLGDPSRPLLYTAYSLPYASIILMWDGWKRAAYLFASCVVVTLCYFFYDTGYWFSPNTPSFISFFLFSCILGWFCGHFFYQLVRLSLVQRLQLEAAMQEAHSKAQEFRRLASTDELTEVPNRRHFFEMAEELHHRARTERQPLSILILDIDHFKEVNDSYGHVVGDEALRVVTQACRKVLRQGDIIGRIGGEEFAVLVPGGTEAIAQRVAERIRESVQGTDMLAEGKRLQLTVSIGVAVDETGGEDFDRLFTRADNALYAAKNSGRNRVRFAEGL